MILKEYKILSIPIKKILYSDGIADPMGRFFL
jgi:hypothetical protein